MQAGKLREAVLVQEPVEERDAIGGVNIVWRTIEGPIPACIEPLTAREALEAQKIEARLSHRILLRIPNLLTEKNRLVLPKNPYTGEAERVFQPFGLPNKDARHMVMRISAMEIRGD